jgi:tRNA-Thr(GGU) m(6)t(6)A37 methyltransferase TsaA
MKSFEVRPIGWIQSSITDRTKAPLQGHEGGVDAWIEVDSRVLGAMHGVRAGSELIVLTWLHQADRDVLQVHPRGNPANALTGVFATRSPDRPNPIGLHVVTVKECRDGRLLVGPIEAISGTPVLDIKPVI